MPREKRSSKPTEPPGKVPAGEENFAGAPTATAVAVPGPGQCDENAPIPESATCQEAAAISDQLSHYIPCGKPVVVIVRLAKDNRSYYMCETCAEHSINNRGGELVLPSSQAPNPVPVPVPPVRRKRRTKAQIEAEQTANAKAAEEATLPVTGVQVSATPAPTMPPPVVIPKRKSEPDALLPFDDIMILAQMEGVPLVNFITQTLQLMGQGKKIQQALEGEKDKEGNWISGGLRPAINEFLARSGAPGFIFVDTMNDNRVFSFRRVGGVKETLDPVLLLQNGCPAEALAASTVKTEYVSLTIREIKGK